VCVCVHPCEAHFCGKEGSSPDLAFKGIVILQKLRTPGRMLYTLQSLVCTSVVLIVGL
jgi:hypothetical protein